MTDLKSDAEKAADYAKTVAGDAVKAETAVAAAEGKVAAFITANKTKIIIGLVLVAALVVWKIL